MLLKYISLNFEINKFKLVNVIDKNEFFFPMFAPEHTAKVFRKFAADGIQGWFGETPDEIGMPFWHTQLETYIAHKLADDPTQDSTQMINEPPPFP